PWSRRRETGLLEQDGAEAEWYNHRGPWDVPLAEFWLWLSPSWSATVRGPRFGSPTRSRQAPSTSWAPRDSPTAFPCTLWPSLPTARASSPQAATARSDFGDSPPANSSEASR